MNQDIHHDQLNSLPNKLKKSELRYGEEDDDGKAFNWNFYGLDLNLNILKCLDPKYNQSKCLNPKYNQRSQLKGKVKAFIVSSKDRKIPNLVYRK